MAAKISLGKKDLIRGHHLFKNVTQKGKKYRGKYILLFAAPCQKGIKVAVSASKRLGGAVKRNRAKRLLREVFRLNRCRIADGFEIVIIALSAPHPNSYRANELELLNLLKKAGCLDTARI